MLRLEVLGPPRFVYAGEELCLPRKAGALLAYLALEGSAERYELVHLLWGSQPEAKGQHNLRQTLYQLSKTPLCSQLQIGRGEIGLQQGFCLDVTEFRQRLEAGQWEAAQRLYRGEFLQGWDLEEEAYAQWVRHHRERLSEQLQTAKLGLAKDLEAQGMIRQALEVYLDLLQSDGLQERLHREVMRLYAALGQPERALAQYRQLQDVLERELALKPLPQTRALAEEIALRSSPPSSSPPPLPRPVLDPPLVGREEVLRRMEAAWQDQKILLLAGPAGIGKSRLAKAFLSLQGPYAVLAGQPEETQTPYASMSRWLREALEANPKLRLSPWVRLEAARLLPELSRTLPPPLEASGQVRFFLALAELLTQAYSGSLFLSEDEHFSDPWSLQALAIGLGKTRRVVTFRSDELSPEVAKRYAAWCEGGVAEWIDLEPLSEFAVAELIAQLSGRPAQLFPRRIYQVTAGNPLFVLETLRSLFESGELRVGEGGVWETPYDQDTHDYTELQIAPSVRKAILSRLDRQGEPVRRSLEVAALIAESSFDSKVLSEATALSEWEVSEALERAGQARLVEPAAQGYRFSHDLIARSIAEALKPDRKRLICAHLARHYATKAVHPARVAGYFQAAGLLEQAVEWWLKAALQAHGLRAFHEANNYYLLALEAMPPEHPKRFEAMAQRFYLCRQVGISSLEEQLQQLQTMEHSAQAALQRSNVWFYRSMVKDDQQDLLGALEASQKAYAFALEVSPAEAFYPLIFVTHYQRDLGLLQEAAADGLKALELAEELSPFHRIEARLCHGLTLMLQDQPEQALAWIEEAEGLMNRHGPAPSSFWLLQERIGAVRARVYNYLGCYAPAVEQVRALIERSRQQKVQRQELIGLWIRAESWLGLGRLSQATEDLERCLELVRQLNWGGSKTHQLYAELELMQQNPKAALRFSERALEEAGMNRVQRINALYSRGGAWLALGERQRAREDLEQALNLHGHTARLHCVNLQFIQTRLKLTMQ